MLCLFAFRKGEFATDDRFEVALRNETKETRKVANLGKTRSTRRVWDGNLIFTWDVFLLK